MLKLVRLALTAAILTAIAVRLRRRARMPAHRPEPAADRRATGMRTGLVWAAIAAIVAVTLAAALVPTEAQEASSARWRAYQAEQAAIAASMERAPMPPAPATAAPFPAQSPTQSPTGSPAQSPTQSPTQDGVAATSTPSLPSACLPRGPVTVRPIDPRVRRAVNRQWRRIERWLGANAPRTYATLGRPGRARTIAIAEAQTGLELPDDLRASLLRHDGMSGPVERQFTLLGHELWGVRQIRDLWRGQCARDGLPGRAVPFAGGGLEIDPAGGHVLPPGAGPAPEWPSYYAMLRDVADALEEGAAVDGRGPAVGPAVRRGRLEWVKAP